MVRTYRIVKTSTVGPEYLLSILMFDGRTLVCDIAPQHIRRIMRLMRSKGIERISSYRGEM